MTKIDPLILAVTTIDNNAHKAFEKFSPYANDHCHVVIAHQATSKLITPIVIDIPNVTYIYHTSKGLSKNRNRILSHIHHGIYVVCDDDVELKAGFEESIRQGFKNSGVQVLTYQTETPEGTLRKKYPKHRSCHNMITILGTSSIEIAFDIDAIKKKGIRFDEEFGLGTSNPYGEENIFLKDCLDAGLSISYIPEVVTIHQSHSSGTNRVLKEKIPLFRKMYGLFTGTIVLIGVTLKKFFGNTLIQRK